MASIFYHTQCYIMHAIFGSASKYTLFPFHLFFRQTSVAIKTSVRVCENLHTLWVDLFGYLERVGVSQVRVGRGHGQQQAVLLGDELHEHVPDLVLNVSRLVTYWHLGHPWQVDQCEVQD